MKIRAFEVPYDSGRVQERMGAGPSYLLKAGLLDRLRFLGHEVVTERVRVPEEFPSEIKMAFAVANRVAAGVKKAREAREFPVVLSGNCNAAVGTLSGLEAGRVGVIWFDAHGEFHTPDTTSSGFLDGMGLAVATGYCWRRLAASIHNFNRVPAKNVLLLGGREIDNDEEELMEKAGVQQLPAGEIVERGTRTALVPALQALARRVDSIYIHFDLDVLDSSVARWNGWSTPGGLTVEQVQEGLECLAGGPPIAALGFASHDPSIDPDGSYEAARRILDCALGVAGA